MAKHVQSKILPKAFGQPCLRQRRDVVTDDMRKSSATTPNTEENTMLLRQTELSDSAERGTARET